MKPLNSSHQPPAQTPQNDIGMPGSAGRTSVPLSVVVLGTLFSLATSACSAPKSDDFVVIEQRPLRDTLLLTGEVRTARAIELIAPQVGMWPIPIETLLPDGTPVVVGQTVAEFDNSNLLGGLDASRERVVQARSSHLTVENRVKSEEADARFDVGAKEIALEKARITADVPEELVSQRDYESSQLELRRAELELATATAKLANQIDKGRAEIGIARVEVDKAENEVRSTQESLEVVVLTAPVDGTVEVGFNADESRVYRPGDNIEPGRTVARFSDYDTLRVEAFLFDVDFGTIDVGATAEIRLDAYPERTFSGHVTELQEVAQQASFQSSRRVFRVIVELDDPDKAIMRSGMSAQVLVTFEVSEWLGKPTLVVDRGAIRFKGPSTEHDPSGQDDVGATVKAELLTEDGWVTASVGRCSLLECIVQGPDAGQRVRRLSPTSAETRSPS